MIYSISRLNTFHNCQYGFYLTYSLHEDREDNIYSFAGTKIHDILDRIYNEKKTYDLDDIQDEFDDFMLECSVFGYRFPTKKTEENWMSDMIHFVSNYKKLESVPLASEERVLLNLDGIWLQGYVDYQEESEDGNINIIDWKTSSKFTGARLKEAGRQLLVYKLAKEAEGKSVDKVGWFMIKYLNITYQLKNGKYKTSMYRRGRWVEKLSNVLKSYLNDYMFNEASIKLFNNHKEEILKLAKSDRKLSNRIDDKKYDEMTKVLLERHNHDGKYDDLLFEYGYDEYYIELLIDESIVNNSIENLPTDFQRQFKIEDCLLWYDYTEEDIQETIDYIKDTVEQIESKDKNNPMDWAANGITENDFYCNCLCSQRQNCYYTVNDEKRKDSSAELPF